MSSSLTQIFQSFLKENLRGEVLVINTNIGMEIYYTSISDCSLFIKESFLLYTLKHIDSGKLRFKKNLTKEAVKVSFCEAVKTFAQYPQIFLAYSKKFIYLIKNNPDSQVIAPLLNQYYRETLIKIAEKGHVPHLKKISAARLDIQSLDEKSTYIFDQLIFEILTENRKN